MLPEEIRRRLLTYARETIDAVVAGKDVPPPPAGGVMNQPAAVFVTLRNARELRGCVGNVGYHEPLGRVVGDMTRSAATSDPRFDPVEPDEADEITIEISRLTTTVPARPEDIVIGRHGIIVSKGPRRGLLLPQVALEFGCDIEQFVELGCRKAGLPINARYDDDFLLQIFEAEVFGE